MVEHCDLISMLHRFLLKIQRQTEEENEFQIWKAAPHVCMLEMPSFFLSALVIKRKLSASILREKGLVIQSPEHVLKKYICSVLLFQIVYFIIY